jgi:hypothetical protein
MKSCCIRRAWTCAAAWSFCAFLSPTFGSSTAMRFHAAVSLGFSDTWKRRKGGEVQLMSKRQRSATPLQFRDLLLDIARGR